MPLADAATERRPWRRHCVGSSGSALGATRDLIEVSHSEPDPRRLQSSAMANSLKRARQRVSPAARRRREVTASLVID